MRFLIDEIPDIVFIQQSSDRFWILLQKSEGAGIKPENVLKRTVKGFAVGVDATLQRWSRQRGPVWQKTSRQFSGGSS